LSTLWYNGVGDNMKRLKYIRLQAHMSQREFSKAIGISYSMLSLYERNKRNFKVQTAHRISRTLQMPFTNLFPEFSWLEGKDVIK